MTERAAEMRSQPSHCPEDNAAPPSPGPKARIAGGLYLIVIAAGMFAELFVRSALIVRGDAAATAANILASEPLFRLGFAADLVSAGCYFAVTFLLYQLLRPVSRSVALLSAFLGISGSVAMALNLTHLLTALAYLGGSAPAAFTAEQSQALALVSLRSHALGYNISGVFFATHLVSLGYLVLRSTFLPRFLGALLGIAGLCYLTNSFAIFLPLAFVAHLYPWILMPGLLAEGGLTLWLLVMGVNASKWREQAGAMASEFGGR